MAQGGLTVESNLISKPFADGFMQKLGRLGCFMKIPSEQYELYVDPFKIRQRLLNGDIDMKQLNMLLQDDNDFMLKEKTNFSD